jgi:hypothetical protein
VCDARRRAGARGRHAHRRHPQGGTRPPPPPHAPRPDIHARAQRHLPNKRHIGKQTPYCAVAFNGERRRTKAIHRGGQHPEWDEEVRFTLVEDDAGDIPRVEGLDNPPPPPPKKGAKRNIKGGKFLNVSVYADDPREPDLIGETKIDLTEVLTKGETDGGSLCARLPHTI